MTCASEELVSYDIALTNLLCASGLPGAEDLDIPHCLHTLDELTALCDRQIARQMPRFHSGLHELYNTPARFRMAWLVQTLKKDFGAHYNPGRLREIELNLPGTLADSRDAFIHGLLGPTRAGTCNSIPVLVVAVARRLGYPVYLTATHYHVWARWDDPHAGERFNIEASGPEGMTIHPDEHYRQFPRPMAEWDSKPGYYLKNFTPADEVAMFVFSRAMCLEENQRWEEMLPCLVRMLELAPAEPWYPRYALKVANMAALARYRRQHPGQFVPEPPPGVLDLPFDPGVVLRAEERVMYGTVVRYFDDLVGPYKHVSRLNETIEIRNNAGAHSWPTAQL